MRDQPFDTTAADRRRMQSQSKGRDTSPELAIRRELWRRGLRYRVDRPLDLPHVRRRADIVFVGSGIAVFVDGCYWHVCPEHGTDPRTNADYWSRKLARNVERDHETDRLAREAGWTVVRVWEHEPPEQAADRIQAVITRAAGAPRDRAR